MSGSDKLPRKPAERAEIDAFLKAEKVDRIPGPHCYEMFMGPSEFDAEMKHELGTFFLTDYMVRHFERIVMQGMGLRKHPQLRDMYFGNYTRALYIAQTEDEGLQAKARAAEVMEVARELAGHVRDWLDRAADRVLDRLGPEQSELALAGGREGREQEPDLATRLREAWEARKEGREQHEADASEREAPDDLAARLRAAATGIDREAFGDRVSALREGREAEEQHVAQEVERQRTKELELEREVHARRDRGHDYGL